MLIIWPYRGESKAYCSPFKDGKLGSKLLENSFLIVCTVLQKEYISVPSLVT